ncbi:hypothetical protein [Lewinella sp. LCG006]|uniref:hypothetical protein n=1 Tax=Lewinella sp. LCG006 TaxID=3231911 RepID=UPI00345F5C5F
MKNINNDVLSGIWTYRSWNNDPNLNTALSDLLFGEGFIQINHGPMNEFHGIIFGTDDNKPGGTKTWQLKLTGSTNYGNPFTVRFQGKGVVGGDEWIYDYVGYLTLPWPNGVDQKAALTGSIVRVIPHPGGDGGLHPAGVTASWYAVKN